MKIKKNIVCMLAYIYMTIPIIIFLITWLKAYIGFPMAVILLFGLFTIYKNEYKGQDTYFKFPIKHLVIILILLFVWIVLSGAGKLFYETWDWHWRNAIFRDLINYKWPVIYEESQTALVYYIMQWIVPAIVGKIGGWSIGNFALMIWNLIGVVLVYFLLIHICKKKDVPIFYAIAIIFMLFGGLNQVGEMITSIWGNGNFSVLGSGDGWLDGVNGYQYSSNYTLISWVFNQTIVPWMSILLILIEKKLCHFAFIGLIVLPYAPIPFVGLFVILAIMGISYILPYLQRKDYKYIIKNIFSIPNICAFFSISICTAAYFSTNINGTKSGWYIEPENFKISSFVWLFIFWLLEVGIYVLPLWQAYKNDYLFHVVWVMLLLIPLFRIGAGRDFCMRGSIIPLFILQIYLINYLISDKAFSARNRYITVFLVAMLSLGGLNTFADVAIKINIMKEENKYPYYSDDVYTLAGGDIEINGNFLTDKLSNSFFFKYMAQ